MKEDLQAKLADPQSFPEAYEELKTHLRENRTLRDYQFGYRLLQDFESDPARRPFTRHVKVAMLTSYTVDFLLPLLKTELMLSDVHCDIYKPHFNQFRQEVLDPNSKLYEFQPDIAIVGFGLDDVSEDALELCDALAATFRANAPAGSMLLLQDFIPPHHAFEPLVQSDGSMRSQVEKLNAGLREIAKRYPNTWVMEYSRVVHDCGYRTWIDPRTYYTARIPVAQQNWLPLAEAHAKHIRALLNLEIKCIVLDLDNTLWGGVLGEDGFDGIQIGETYPGIVFKRFQQYLLSLYAHGYILAISSKNNADDVLHVLREHPAMVLREEHFAAIKANWQPKEENIREISREIQISVDHMMFVDDNRVEVQKVKSAIPGISCLLIDSPPMDFVRQFEHQRCIGKILITEEDKHRGRQYFDDRKRREFKQSSGTINDFYRSLEQRLTVHINNPRHRARIAQLSQRTNQFNMTTMRLTESNVDEMMNRPEYWLATADLADRFGDSGTIAYIQVRKSERVWVIENFLMSCRVLGRTVEESLLDYVSRRANEEGAESVLASYIPSKKNQPFADFYPRNGFVECEAGAAGERRFLRNVAAVESRISYIEIIDDQSVCGSVNVN